MFNNRVLCHLTIASRPALWTWLIPPVTPSMLPTSADERPTRGRPPLMLKALGSRPVQFTKGLRDRVRSGEITCSIRIWKQPRVKVGGRYSLPPGKIIVESLLEISLADITPALARRSGFTGVVDLLKTAKHGQGRRVFLVEFRYVT